MSRPHAAPSEKQSGWTKSNFSVWWTKSNFLGLLLKCGNDQWGCEIGNYYVALPLQHSSIRTFFELVGCKMFWLLLGYIATKAWANPRNLTLLTRPFLLVRGWEGERVGSGNKTRTRCWFRARIRRPSKQPGLPKIFFDVYNYLTLDTLLQGWQLLSL